MPDKLLHFFDRGTFNAPFSIDESSNIRNVKVKKDRQEYRNRQYVRAGQDISTVQIRTFKGDGETQTFSVDLPIAKVPTIKVNGVAGTVGIRGVETNKDWYWQKNDKTISQDSAGTKLSASDTLTVEFQGYYPIMAVSESPEEINNRRAIEGGSGIYENIEEKASLDTKEAALDYSSGLLRRYAKIAKTLTFDTFTAGLKAGMLLPVNIPTHGINNEKMLISKVTINDLGAADSRLNYAVECLDGEAVGGWVNFFKKIVQQGKTFVIREPEKRIGFYYPSFIQTTRSSTLITDGFGYTFRPYIGSTFTFNKGSGITSISVAIRRQGTSLTNPVRMYLFNVDANGLPTTQIALSPTSIVPPFDTWSTFYFNIALAPGTYAWAVYSTGSTSTSNEYRLSANNNAYKEYPTFNNIEMYNDIWRVAADQGRNYAVDIAIETRNTSAVYQSQKIIFDQNIKNAVLYVRSKIISGCSISAQLAVYSGTASFQNMVLESTKNLGDGNEERKFVYTVPTPANKVKVKLTLVRPNLTTAYEAYEFGCLLGVV